MDVPKAGVWGILAGMKKIDKPLLGAVYLIEPHVEWRRQELDLRNMAATGLGVVVLWPPCSRWDAADGVSMAFDSIDRAMELCRELGLRVILELEGQNPAFQFAADSQWTEDMLPQSDRARHWVNYMHPRAAEQIDEYIRAVARHFKGHAALWGYDLFNEVNFHSTDEHTVAAFRRWLAGKYASVRQMNMIWGRFYGDWKDVHPANFGHPYSKWSSLRPLLDWEDFRADTIAGLVSHWGKVVREIDQQAVLIADNSWSMTTFDTTILGNDDWKVAGAAEVFGLSVYPQSWDVRLRDDACAVSQIYRGGVSAGGVSRGRSVMVSELQTHNQTALARGSSVFDEVRLWTWQALAHGVDGLIYWKWNPFTRGFQVSGRGMTDAAGNPNHRASQAAEVARVLAEHGGALGGRRVFDSGVALAYEPTADRFTDLVTPDEKGLYRASLAGWYRYLWQRGVIPTIVRLEDLDGESLEHVRVLIMPGTMMLSSAGAQTIAGFIKRGGSVIADSRFAIVDENGFAYERAPGGLNEAMGYVEVDYLSPYDDKDVAAAERFCVVTPAGGQVIGRSRLGHPAAVVTDRTLYLATPFGLDIAKGAIAGWVEEFLLPRLDRRHEVMGCAPDVDVVISETDKHVLLAATNYARQARSIRARLDGRGGVTNLFPSAEMSSWRQGDATIVESNVPARSIAGVLMRR